MPYTGDNAILGGLVDDWLHLDYSFKKSRTDFKGGQLFATYAQNSALAIIFT
jgi:hypothetical protein